MRLRTIILFTIVFFQINVFAQGINFEWRLENEKMISPTSYQFDVYLYNLGSNDFELRGGTVAFNVDSAWRNGGTVDVTHTSSELNTNQINSSDVYIKQTMFTPEYFRKIINSVALGQGTTIPANKRLKCYTFILNNTVAFSTKVPPKFAWKFAAGGAGFNYTESSTNKLITVVSYYSSQLGPNAVSNQKYCFTPAYWTGNSWQRRSSFSSIDTVAPPSKYHEVNIYNGTYSGGLDIRGYVLMPWATHNLNSAQSLTLRADLANYGNLTSSASSIFFEGNDIPGTDRREYSSNAFTCYKLSQNNPYDLSIGGATVVLNQLSFSKGNILVNNNNLIIGDSANIIGYSDSGFVVTDSAGKLIIQNIGPNGKTGMITFPVGNENSYSPAYISNIGTTDHFYVSVLPGIKDSAGIVNSKAVNKTWSITENLATGSDVDLSLQWNASDELPLFDRTQSYVSIKNNSNKWFSNIPISAIGNNPFSQTYSHYTDLASYSQYGVGSNGALSNGIISNVNFIKLKNATATQIIPSKGARNVVLYRVDVTVFRDTTPLQSLQFTTSGTYQAKDLLNFKLWFHNNSNFAIGNPVLIYTKTSGLDAGTQIFNNLTKTFPVGTSYIFFTADLPCQATNTFIAVNAIANVDFQFSNGTVIGSNYTSSTVTINPLPVVANIAGQTLNVKTSSTYSYSVTQQLNSTYIWSAINGIIINGQGTNAVNVQWQNGGVGNISVIGINQFQCRDTANLQVSIVNNVGLAESLASKQFQVYPNPNLGDFIIKLESNRKSSSIISLYNMLGQEVWSNAYELSMGENEIPIYTKLSAGMYVLKIHSEAEGMIKQVVIR